MLMFYNKKSETRYWGGIQTVKRFKKQYIVFRFFSTIIGSKMARVHDRRGRT